jgi:hypothetical protein
MNGRVAVGLDSTQTEFDALGETGGDKASTAAHTHLIPHEHSIDHDHPSFNTATGGTHNHATNFSLTADTVGDHDHGVSATNLENHTHGMPARQTSSTSHTHTGSSTVAAGMSGADVTPQTYPPAFVYITPDVLPGGSHSHSVSGTINVNAGEGGHAHAIDVPAFSGTSGSSSAASSGASSVGAVSGNLQPYAVLNYIIKT